MQKKLKNKWYFSMIVCAMFLFLVPLLFADNKNIEYRKGLFSWDAKTIEPENRIALYQITTQLEINEVYQELDQIAVTNANAYALSNELHDKNIDLYLLTGSRKWTYEPDGKPMLDEIARAVAFRDHWGKDKLKGIVFDIEPYTSQRWKDGEQDLLMKNYVTAMRTVYDVAKGEALRVVLCIPKWFDLEYKEVLIELMDCCDEISVMNYGRTDEYENIADEIEYARARNQDITCIFEFQAVGAHGLTEDKTYHDLGVDIAKQNFEKLYNKAGYSNLKFAYHYLEPLKQMLLK